jgi:hypothetical protein
MLVILDVKRRLTVPTALAHSTPGDVFDAHFDAEDVLSQPAKRHGDGAPPRPDSRHRERS